MLDSEEIQVDQVDEEYLKDYYYYAWKKKFLLGLVVIHYWCEDRRPDLTREQAQTALGYKYKHSFTLRIGFKSVTWIVWSLAKGFYSNPWEPREAHDNELPTRRRRRFPKS